MDIKLKWGVPFSVWDDYKLRNIISPKPRITINYELRSFHVQEKMRTTENCCMYLHQSETSSRTVRYYGMSRMTTNYQV